MLQAFYSLSILKRIAIGFAVSIVSAYIVHIVFSFLFALAHGMSFYEYSHYFLDINSNNNRNIIHSKLFLQALVVFTVPALILIKALSPHGIKDAGICSTVSAKKAFLVAGVIVVFIPGINLLSALNTGLVQTLISEDSIFHTLYQTNEKILSFLLQGHGASVLLKQLFFMAVVPAVAEELFFRGAIQTYFITFFKNKHVAIITAAAIFSILHADIFNFIPRTLMGCIFGYMYYRYGTLWLPIIGHFIHNGIVVVIYYLIRTNSLPESAETFGQAGISISIGVVSLLIIGYISFVFFRKRSVEVE